MTNYLTVVVDKALKDDDLKLLVAAIGLLKGVTKVTAEPIADMTTFVAEARVKGDLLKKVADYLG